MGALSRTEINLQRLLRHCETMATEAQHKEQKVDWRLSKVSFMSIRHCCTLWCVF